MYNTIREVDTSKKGIQMLSNSKVWIGIDPGASGAIGLIDENNETKVLEVLNVFEMVSVLREFIELYDIQIVILEEVHAMAKIKASINFKLGMNFGQWQGVLTTLRIPYRLVPPKVWQRNLVKKQDGKDSKERSLNVARRLFPDTDLSRKKDHNKADALLIAYFAKNLKTEDRD